MKKRCFLILAWVTQGYEGTRKQGRRDCASHDVLIFTCRTWDFRGENDMETSEVSGREGLGIMNGHAAANETSLMMGYYPEGGLPASTGATAPKRATSTSGETSKSTAAAKLSAP